MEDNFTEARRAFFSLFALVCCETIYTRHICC